MVLAWCARARAEEDWGAWLGNSPAAAATAYAAPVQTGHVFLSLALVVALVLALYWGLKQLQRRQSAAVPEAAPARILLRAQFNAAQTLEVSERGGDLRCLILRGQRTEFQAEVPGAFRPAVSGSGAPQRKASFQEIWRSLLRGGDKPTKSSK
jgi:hypothetical protein